MTATTDWDGALDALEAAYGPASAAGFGSGVFRVPLAADGDLVAVALGAYRAFVGSERWERLGGDAAWLGPWGVTWERGADGAAASADIVAALRALPTAGARMSAGLLLDELDDAAAARAALAAVYDAPVVSRVIVCTVGDGAAMSGLAIAGHAPSVGQSVVLVLLMD